MPNQSHSSYAYFGSSEFSIIVLDEMKKSGFVPSLIVTTADKPQGRKMVITPNIVKTWANKNNIKCFSPEKLDDAFVLELKNECNKHKIDVFIVASYGKIIPDSVLQIPIKKTLNIHPSLLPIYRGASPLQSAILDDAKDTGVTIMRIDKEMDHGPIVAQKSIHIDEWPIYEVFEEMMAKAGANLLVEVLPKWISGEISEVEQDHKKATYTKKTAKSDGQIDIVNGDIDTNFRKIQAYHRWPQAYFIHNHDGREMRVKITSASIVDGKLQIEKVIPEGSKEMSYDDFTRGFVK